MIAPFTFASPSRITFGAGSIRNIGKLCVRYGDSVILVTGGGSLERSGKLGEIERALADSSVSFRSLSVHGEPSPELVDEAVRQNGDRRVEAVLAVGGGSVMDFGKAVSAMLPIGGMSGVSVVDFLEGVGTRAHDGTKVPFIAVPTTAGTGSEATKNAVLSRVGRDGFKKSIRHDNFVPDVAVIDPELSVSCPADVTAACGMDALSQLLESYFSTKANPMTDALALSGIAAVGGALVAATRESPGDLDARARMAYGALISGITLANAGLGLVHGMASVIGGAYDISHGVVCANLMGPAMRRTLDALKKGAAGAEAVLKKFAAAGALLDGRDGLEGHDTDYFSTLLIEKLNEWTELLSVPRFGTFGMREEDIAELARRSDNKNNPAQISTEGMVEIIRERL
jgi:alcohol dehydrogenase class IV